MAIATTATLWDTIRTTPATLPHGRGPHAVDTGAPDLASSGTAPAGGQVHLYLRYLMRMTAVGDCLPVLFPPGVLAPRNVGVEVELYLAGPAERPAVAPERSRYHEVAQRVRRTSIRCEGCGARFADLGAYRVHDCEVHYR